MLKNCQVSLFSCIYMMPYLDFAGAESYFQILQFSDCAGEKSAVFKWRGGLQQFHAVSNCAGMVWTQNNCKYYLCRFTKCWEWHWSRLTKTSFKTTLMIWFCIYEHQKKQKHLQTILRLSGYLAKSNGHTVNELEMELIPICMLKPSIVSSSTTTLKGKQIVE